MKFLLIGYYHLADGFKGAATALEKYGHQMEFFPLTEYYDLYKLDAIHYLESFISRKIEKSHITTSSKYIDDNIPDVILWWNFNIDLKYLIMSKKYKIINIFYTWDDPFWSDNRQDDRIFEHIDIAFTCCNRATEYYRRNGCKNVVYLPPGFDPDFHKPIDMTDDSYDCDVSLICTNLYNKPPYLGKCIDRKSLLDTIIADQTISVNVYGPQFLAELYPNNYKGFVPFADTHVIYNRSRINLNTHVRRDGDMYINERTTQILGSRGLLMIDDIGGIDKLFKREQNCVVIQEYNIVNQIKHILKNYSQYEKIKEAGYQYALEKFTWDSWARAIHYRLAHYNYKYQIDTTPITDDVLKQIYLISQAIHNSNFSITNYLLLLSKICDQHNIDYNLFLSNNIHYITSNIKLI